MEWIDSHVRDDLKGILLEKLTRWADASCQHVPHTLEIGST